MNEGLISFFSHDVWLLRGLFELGVCATRYCMFGRFLAGWYSVVVLATSQTFSGWIHWCTRQCTVPARIRNASGSWVWSVGVVAQTATWADYLRHVRGDRLKYAYVRVSGYLPSAVITLQQVLVAELF